MAMKSWRKIFDIIMIFVNDVLLGYYPEWCYLVSRNL